MLARRRGERGGLSNDLRSAELGVGGERLIVVSYRTPDDVTALSAAEQSIVELVCRGLDNAEIARVRGTRPRTVANQLATIYRKLGVASRVELAASLIEALVSPKTSDLVSVIEAAYGPAADDKTWLSQVIHAFDGNVGSPLGCHGFFLDASVLEDVRVSDADTSCLRVSVDVARASIPANAEQARPFYASKYAGTATGQIGVAAWRTFPPYQQFYKPAGVEDILGVICLDSTRVGCVLAVALPRRVRLGARQEARYSRLAIHVATALRLRRSLPDGRCHDGTEGADAVLSPSGEILHADGEAKDSTHRGELRRMARAVDRARSRLRREDPDHALEIWTALVSGRWTLIDFFDSDGRRFLVARENSPSIDQPSALTALERSVAASAALGHPQKLIAYELGLRPSVVSSTLASALQKLGIRSAAELAAVLGAFVPSRK